MKIQFVLNLHTHVEQTYIGTFFEIDLFREQQKKGFIVRDNIQYNAKIFYFARDVTYSICHGNLPYGNIFCFLFPPRVFEKNLV